jgi:hypothetical protein
LTQIPVILKTDRIQEVKKMKNKTLIAGLLLLMILATTITAFAFTGRSQIAYDESRDTWVKFRDEMFENKKAFIEERVKDGTLTREEGDEILDNIEFMQENCPAYGSCRGMGRGFGMGFRGGRCGRGSW